MTVATPNEAADTGLLRVIPDGGQNDPVTTDLVHTIRDQSAQIEAEAGVSDLRVTGTTAINIDVSERLADAMLPFALTVVGLSFLLLAIVFRSIAVPLKATVGYLLSVGAAFGAIVGVFQLGWLPGLLGGYSPGPLVSFLPILVMGVLFGLAMDYEMFLVSRMREEYTHTGNAQEAIRVGFSHSAPVVTAAAVIMIAVFAAFVPTGSQTIRPIAFGLAVGVFVDAFLVRMTLVPAVLALLGDRAWWMPAWLSRVLPPLDIEGEAVLRQTSVDENPARSGAAVSACKFQTAADVEPLSFELRPGQVHCLDVADVAEEIAVAYSLSGRAPLLTGDVAVYGMILPERAESVRRITMVATADSLGAAETAREYATSQTRLAGGSRRLRRARLQAIKELFGNLDVRTLEMDPAKRQRLVAAVAFACGARLIFLPGNPSPDLPELLVDGGATVVLFRHVSADLFPAPLANGALL